MIRHYGAHQPIHARFDPVEHDQTRFSRQRGREPGERRAAEQDGLRARFRAGANRRRDRAESRLAIRRPIPWNRTHELAFFLFLQSKSCYRLIL
jgi:hypothetical protein